MATPGSAPQCGGSGAGGHSRLTATWVVWSRLNWINPLFFACSLPLSSLGQHVLFRRVAGLGGRPTTAARRARRPPSVRRPSATSPRPAVRGGQCKLIAPPLSYSPHNQGGGASSAEEPELARSAADKRPQKALDCGEGAEGAEGERDGQAARPGSHSAQDVCDGARSLSSHDGLALPQPHHMHAPPPFGPGIRRGPGAETAPRGGLGGLPMHAVAFCLVFVPFFPTAAARV